MRKRMSAGALAAIAVFLISFLSPSVANAAQTLAQVQAQINRLEEEATTAAEGA